MASSGVVAVRGLFQRNIAGDDALLGLTRLRFRQAGMGAELYAETPGELERLLSFVPESDVAPTVHLDRRIDLLRDDDRELVAQLQQRFAGRIDGLIIHDRSTMADRLDATAAVLMELGHRDSRSTKPTVFLEFANGLSAEQFVELAESIKDVEHASMCIDVGHVGIAHARSMISRGLGTRGAPSLFDPALAIVIEPIAEAIASALGAVTTMIDALADIDKRVHLHLHDGHPLRSGTADHLGFLTQVPIPFAFHHQTSLPQLYGPSGLATILRHAQRSNVQPSYTLEIHQTEGRLPLRDAQPLFAHWVDLTNAERMNYWLSVLAENHLLTVALLSGSMIENHSGDDHDVR